jgi:hypothetical protein
VSGAPRTYNSKPDALRYNSPDCPVNQRSNGSLRTNGHFVRKNNDEQCRAESEAQKLEHIGLSGVTPECPVQQDDKTSQWSTAPNPNGCANVAHTWHCTLTVRWRTRLSGAPIASRNQAMARSGWEAINTPQPLHSLLSKHSEFFIHCKSKSPTLQDTIKAINPLKAPKSTLVH